MLETENCPACAEEDKPKGRGYFYAVLTAILCPCHLPVLGLYLGTGSAGAFFAENFVLLAIGLGLLTLFSLNAAIRILL